MTKYKVSNLFDIIIKIVKKCCATHFQGNYTKISKEKLLDNTKISQRKKALVICYLKDSEIDLKILRFVKSAGQ